MRHIYGRVSSAVLLAVLTLLAVGQPKAAAAPAPDCHILTVGVDKYVNKQNNLSGCVNDAKAVAQFYAGQKGKLYANTAVSVLLDRQATQAGIRNGLAGLQKAGKAGDHYVLFLEEMKDLKRRY